ncbi:MAG: chromosome segregation protein SMC [Chloroflexi bacterium]|nr:chromosome segregation protein SMC [Chloroflexota bacterium]
MKLRSLDLHGFKTFARPTHLVFSPRVTAIVGPNGAGKSNLVDALRWVLGETSLQMLRARRTEDLIFAGSAQRPRAGAAVVTVVLDNADGALPIDFSEVALTRRAYRDGQVEYRLNGRRVRLRDVKELLAQVGLADPGHVFIGQGMVDAILALRPEERRRLFEDAAGIGLYRQRRDEALRRLEATRRNVERVQDILTELRPQLERLEKIIQRAREIEVVQAELRAALRLAYAARWHQAITHARQLLRELQQAEQSLAEVRARVQAWEAEQQARFEQIQALRAQRRALMKALQAAQAKWEQHDRRRVQLEEALRHDREALAQLRENIAHTQQTLARQQTLTQQAQADLQRWTEALHEAQKALEAARITLEERLRARRAKQKALDQARRALNRLYEQQAGRRAQRETLLQQRAQLHERVQTLARTLHQAQHDLEAAQIRVAEAEAQWHDAQAAHERAQAALARAQKEEAQTQTALEAAQSVLADLEARVQRLRARLEALEHAEADLVGHDETARQAVRRLRERARGLLGPAIVVDEAYERAVAGALDVWADAVLLAKADEAAWRALRDIPGRVPLAPLDVLEHQPPGPAPAPDLPGVIARAWDLVRVTQSHAEPAARAWLSWVWVVRDRAAALALRGQIPEGIWLVTLDGDVFTPQGLVLAGRPRGQQVLRRARERERLVQQLATLEAQLAEARRAWEQAHAAWQTAREARVQAEQRVETARAAAQRAREAWQQAQWQLRAAQQRRETLAQQQAELQAELKALEHQLHELEQALQDLATQIEQAKAKVRAHQEALHQLDVSDLRAQVASWEAQRARAEQALTAAQRRAQEEAERLAHLQHQLERLQGQLRAREHAEAERAAQWAEARAQAAEAWTALRQLQAKLEPLEQQLQALEEAHASAQAKSPRGQLTRAADAVTQARIRWERHRAHMDTLRRRAQEELGPVRLPVPQELTGQLALPLPDDVPEAEGDILPDAVQVPPDLDARIRRLRQRLRRLGPPPAEETRREYEALRQRVTFLEDQLADLQKAEADLRQLLTELETTMRRDFRRTFRAINQAFGTMFKRLFGGGQARLVLLQADDPDRSGVDIEVRLPGKRAQRLAMLSGGERSLTAVALLFALLDVAPTPFCVLDEVDAMLDEANVARFADLVREMSHKIQFVLITHNRHTIQRADVLYGVTLGEDGVSQVLSLNLETATALVGSEAAEPTGDRHRN